MEETSTVINWPSRLKVGAKSKKGLYFISKIKSSCIFFCNFYLRNSDPHVRVAGKAENTKLARDKIMQMLDTRVNYFFKTIH